MFVRAGAAIMVEVPFEIAAVHHDNGAMHNLFRILFGLALVFAVTMAVLPHPPELPGEPSDKLQHMLAFATLAVLAVLGYPAVSKVGIALGLVAVGAGIEVVQMIPQLHRDAEWMDLVADTGAILVMLAVATVAFGRRGKAR
jgi:hypothetical protein